jgi:hypothetical protein
MWTKSDIIALLQLLAMVMLAAVQAAWCLLVHQCKIKLNAARTYILTIMQVDLRRYVKEPRERVGSNLEDTKVRGSVRR